jgi:uncharacterized protein (DUF58 family)
MTSLLRRVKTRLSIQAQRKARGLLDGEYTSVFHGRSIDFDDLRPYVAGDEPKDIDWKATARHGTPLTRRYIASRKHTVMLVVDTGRNMAALAASGEPKSELTIMAAGVIGYIAIRHGDRVALVTGNEHHSAFQKAGSTEAHLERLLRRIDAETTLESPRSDLTAQLVFVARTFNKRMILLVIADDRELGGEELRLLRRLSIQHEILWLTVADADLLNPDWAERGMHDVASSFAIPNFVRSSAGLRKEFDRSVVGRTQRALDDFQSLSISSQRLTSVAGVVPGLFRLLELHRHARR